MTRCLCLSALLIAAPLALADDAAEARKIVERGVKAIGRTEKDQIRAHTYKATGNFTPVPGAAQPYKGTWSVQYPDKCRMELDTFGTFVINGSKGWVNEGGMTNELPDAVVKSQLEDLYGEWVGELVPLLVDKAFTLATAAEEKVDDKPTNGVRVLHQGHRDILLHFDRETGLLVKVDETIKDESDVERKQETFFKDYGTFAKIKIPKKVIVKRDGESYFDAVVTDYQEMDNLPDKTFEKP